MGEDELLPCPFCGDRAEAFVGQFGTTIMCDDGDCGARMTGASKGNAVRRWNTRTLTKVEDDD